MIYDASDVPIAATPTTVGMLFSFLHNVLTPKNTSIAANADANDVNHDPTSVIKLT